VKQSFQLLLKRIRVPEATTPPWGLPLGFGLVIMYFVVFFVSFFFIASNLDFALDTFAPEPLAFASLLATFLMGILLWQYGNTALSDSKLSLQQALGLQPSINTPFYGVVLIAFVVVIIVDIIGLILGVAEDSLPIPLRGVNINDDPVLFGAAVIAIIVTRPIIEELLFRGVLYSALAKQLNNNQQAVIVSALAFGVFHFAIDTQLWWGAFYSFALGLTAGAARAATKSTYSAIGVHAMFGIFIVLRAILTT